MELKFYICAHCGNIIMKVKDKGVPVMCCSQKMKEIIPGTTDGALLITPEKVIVTTPGADNKKVL